MDDRSGDERWMITRRCRGEMLVYVMSRKGENQE
jgi:hypothetical protein